MKTLFIIRAHDLVPDHALPKVQRTPTEDAYGIAHDLALVYALDLVFPPVIFPQ